MRLPDFTQSEEFRALFRKMRITSLVDFRKADWTPLPPRGIDLEDINLVETSPDRTLSYQGHRVLVYIRDQWVAPDGEPREYKYHVAECLTLQEMRRNKRFGRYVATDRKDGVFIVNYTRFGEDKPFDTEVEAPLGVCRNCLRELDWEAYKSARSKQARLGIVNGFSPSKFFERYDSLVSVLPDHSEHTAPLNAYPANWEEISQAARSRASWRCDKCGVDLVQHRNYLHVHHRDGNRANNLSSNLQVLCIRCHGEAPAHGQVRISPQYQKFMRLIVRGTFDGQQNNVLICSNPDCLNSPKGIPRTVSVWICSRCGTSNRLNAT